MKKFSKTVVVILVLLILLTAYWAWEGRLPDLASLRKAQQETQIAGQDGETLSLQESRPDGASGGQNAGTVQETAGPEPQGTQENGTDRTAEGVRPAQPVETGYATAFWTKKKNPSISRCCSPSQASLRKRSLPH